MGIFHKTWSRKTSQRGYVEAKEVRIGEDFSGGLMEIPERGN